MTDKARRAVFGGAVALVAAASALYGTAHLWGNGGPGACAGSAATLDRLAPLSRGEVAAFEVAARPAVATDISFRAPGGDSVTLASFRGRTVLLNLWATWCEPCKREMPALDRLQKEVGGARFEVVAVNIDTRDLERPKRWLDEAGILHLTRYSDPEAKIFQDLRKAGEAEGLPTTLLIGPDGCRLGRLAGWAEWASPDGMALIRAALAR